MNRTLTYAISLCCICAAAAPAAIENITQGTKHDSIQAALDAAVAGDEIVVDPGEYFENIDTLGKQVVVRSVDPTDPDIVLSTIINGGGAGSVVTCQLGELDNTVISGFLITNGAAPFGGGVRCDIASPTISYCTIAFNVATQDRGGGIFAENSDPILEHCTFLRNQAATIGGGAAFWNGDPELHNCRFLANTVLAGGYGSGIAGQGQLGADITVSNCLFIGNTGERTIYASNGRLNMTDCTVVGSGSAAGGGGGLFFRDGPLTLVRCTFTRNDAAGPGGALYIRDDSTATLTDCDFTGNTSGGPGGAVFVLDSTATFNGCSLIANDAGSGMGGGIAGDGAYTLTLAESTVRGNAPGQIDGAFTDGGGNVISELLPPRADGQADACPEDIDGDGDVDQADLGALLAAYDQACP